MLTNKQKGELNVDRTIREDAYNEMPGRMPASRSGQMRQSNGQNQNGKMQIQWGRKENSLYETVTLDTSPYMGPSKLDMLDRL